MTISSISEQTDINGKSLFIEYHYNDDDKPTLVFLHDSLGCTQVWRDFPHHLAAATQCNLLIYDRLGYGKSESMLTHERPNNYMELEAGITNDILEHFDISDAILFGHSDGGTIALLTAALYPNNIKAVIAEAAHIFVEDVTLQGIYDAIEAFKTTNLPQRLEKYHGHHVETLFRAWTETWTREDYRDWNIEHLLKQITCPVLFIQGEKDEFGTLLQVDKTIEAVNGPKEKFILPNIGHSPHRDAPEIVCKKASEFITQFILS